MNKNEKKLGEIYLEGSAKDVVDEFYRWSVGTCKTNFSAKLFELICKADPHNSCKLVMGFPLEVILVNKYLNVEGWFEQFKKEYKISRGLE